MESPGLRVCVVFGYGVHNLRRGESESMARTSRTTTSERSPEPASETTPLASGLYDGDVMIVHRGVRPIMAFIIQAVRSGGGILQYRIKQEFPDMPRYFPVIVWYDTEQEAKDAVERWVEDNIDRI